MVEVLWLNVHDVMDHVTGRCDAMNHMTILGCVAMGHVPQPLSMLSEDQEVVSGTCDHFSNEISQKKRPST